MCHVVLVRGETLCEMFVRATGAMASPHGVNAMRAVVYALRTG